MSNSPGATAPSKLQSVVIAGGGTAGHVFPALALYRALRHEGVKVTLLTDERGLRYAGDFDSADVETLPSGGLVSGSVTKRVKNLLKLGSGYVQSRKRLKAMAPDVVVGMGGYASVGPLLAAQHLKIRNVLHDQNSVMGQANKLTARRADVVALSFDPTEGAPEGGVITGNLCRADVVAVGAQPFVAPAADGPFTILVMGGSQGAKSISENVPAALAALPEPLRSRLRVTHQGRVDDHPAVRAAYEGAGVEARIESFVDVPEELATTHLVITRAGASTVCDVAVARRAAIYLPLLTHADLQQVKNGAVVVQAGGAILHREDEGTTADLAAHVETLMTNPDRLVVMADAAHGWSRPDAVDALIALL